MRVISAALVCAVFTTSGNSAAQAAETVVEGTASERIGFDDNVGWTRNNAISDVSSVTALGLSFGNRTEAHELDLRSRFLFTNFLDESDLDSNDQYVVAEGAIRTPRSRTGLAAEYARDTTRTSQEDDTGAFLLDNIRQQEVTLRPNWSFQATRLDRFSLEAEYRNVDYDRQLVDNDGISGELSWNHGLTSTSEFTLSGSAEQIDFDRSDNRQVRLFGLDANFTTELSPQLRLSIGAGPYWAELSADPTGSAVDADDDTLGVLANADLTFDFDDDIVLEASYRRFVAPSGSGNVVIRDRFDASFEQDWNATVSWGMALRFQAQDDLLGSSTTGRDFFRVAPSIDWRITEDWIARASYRFRWQSVEGQDDDSVSNAAFVTLTYRPESWTL